MTPCSRRTLLAGAAAMALIALAPAVPPAAAAAEKLISAPEAAERTRRGELLLVDVRSPGEWRATGLPEGAHALSIHDPAGARGFRERVRALVGDDRDRPVALICAGGVRSARARRILEDAGFTRVLDVGEGMEGSASGPGWLAHGLPTEPCGAC